MSTSTKIIVAEEVPAEVATADCVTQSASSVYLSQRQRRTRVRWLMVLGVVYGISFLVPRSNLPHVPLCWLHATTGLSCPTCGMTRAFTEIGHGNFAAAAELNVMAIPLFLVGLAIAAALAHEIFTNRNWLVAWFTRHRLALIILGLASVLLRYAPFY